MPMRDIRKSVILPSARPRQGMITIVLTANQKWLSLYRLLHQAFQPVKCRLSATITMASPPPPAARRCAGISSTNASARDILVRNIAGTPLPGKNRIRGSEIATTRNLIPTGGAAGTVSQYLPVFHKVMRITRLYLRIRYLHLEYIRQRALRLPSERRGRTCRELLHCLRRR